MENNNTMQEALNTEKVKEMIEKGNFLGEADHPVDVTDVKLQGISQDYEDDKLINMQCDRPPMQHYDEASFRPELYPAHRGVVTPPIEMNKPLNYEDSAVIQPNYETDRGGACNVPVVEENIDMSLLDTQPLQDGDLETGINVDNTSVTEGVDRPSDMMSSFNSAMAQYDEINKMVNAGQEIYKAVYAEINNYAVAITGKKLKLEQINKIKTLVGARDVNILSASEINNVFRGANVTLKDLDKTKLQEGVTVIDVLKAFLGAIMDTQETDTIFENAMMEKKNIVDAAMHQMDELLGSIDMAEQLSVASEQYDAETDPEKKKLLKEQYMGIYSSLSLDLVMSKLRNKPLNIIKKDCKREYPKLEKKARKTIIEDKVNSFLDIKNLRQALVKLFPDKADEVQLLLYIIYKKLTKRKEVPTYLCSFLNYFVLYVSKLHNKAFQNEPAIIEYKNKIESVLEKLA